MKSRCRNKYFVTTEPLLDTEVKLRQIIQVDGTYYAIIMIGVMWLQDVRTLEFNPERCVVAKVNPHNGELVSGPMYNVLLKTE